MGLAYPQQLDTYCYIQEQTSFDDDYHDFGYEVHDKGDRFFLTFPAVLQSFGVVNRNKRKYSASNIMWCIEHDDYIKSMLKQNSWIGEIDHPAPELDKTKLSMQRIATPNPERSSHYIRSPHLNADKTLLEANIQTDNATEAGRNFALKIVDGKIHPCFSARVLGSLQNDPSGYPTVYVKKLVTYDWVFYPSHREAMAKITQPLQESHTPLENEIGCKIIQFKELAQSASRSSKETEMLCEAFDLDVDDLYGVTSTGNSVVVTENKNTYVVPIQSKKVREKAQSMLDDFLNG